MIRFILLPQLTILALALLTNDGQAATPRVVLSEIVARNQSGLKDETGKTSDWIELYNPGKEAVDLQGWRLTDKAHARDRWTFPAITIPPRGFLVIFASGKDRRSPDSPLHTSFKLSQKGDYLGLISADGQTVVDEWTPKYPSQTADSAYGLTADFFVVGAEDSLALRERHFLQSSTPGKPNASALSLGAAPALPRCSLSSGIFDQPFEVLFTAPTPGATLIHTLDGSVPHPGHSPPLTGPLKIDRTRVVRVVSVSSDGKLISAPLLRTFILTGSTLRQRGEGFPSTWGEREGKPVPADYEMDPEIVDHPDYKADVATALKVLPSLSIVLPTPDLFGSMSGIYAHPMETGSDWEREAALDWIPIKDEKPFQLSAGIRIQGGWNRRPEECPKHSFRIAFRKKYGEGNLEAPLFGEGVGKFDELILRGGCNNSWLHWSGEERKHGDYLRDQWMRDTYRAMGRLSARGRFAHVYLNGLYWGIYNVVERPAPPFLAAHLGGDADDYEARNADHVLSGSTNTWNELMNRVNAGVSTPQAYEELQKLLDVPAFIDYMLLNLYGANADYDRGSNWYAARPRKDGRYVFYVWDGERTLEWATDNRLAYDDDQSPARIFQKLRENPEFRVQFGDRAYQMLTGEGPLSSEMGGTRYRDLGVLLEDAIVLESARWGDYRRDVHPYKTEPYDLYTPFTHWRPEVERIITQYFPERPGEFIRQLRDVQLFPSTDAPRITRSGPRINISPVPGVIYYTVDGNDPREVGGAIHGTAQRYLSSFEATPGTRVRVRALAGDPARGDWSALVELQ